MGAFMCMFREPSFLIYSAEPNYLDIHVFCFCFFFFYLGSNKKQMKQFHAVKVLTFSFNMRTSILGEQPFNCPAVLSKIGKLCI